jgi:hypothetical protein
MRFRANVAAGHYFLTVTLARWDTTKEDVRFDALDLIVSPTPTLHTASVVNLDIAFEPRYAANTLDPIVVPLGPFAHEGGLAWHCVLPDSIGTGDSADEPTHSRLALFEDERRLGPAHSDHDSIRRIGRGMYSHWDGKLYLSIPDGSDPNQNGRRYVAVLPR